MYNHEKTKDLWLSFTLSCKEKIIFKSFAKKNLTCSISVVITTINLYLSWKAVKINESVKTTCNGAFTLTYHEICQKLSCPITFFIIKLRPVFAELWCFIFHSPSTSKTPARKWFIDQFNPNRHDNLSQKLLQTFIV